MSPSLVVACRVAGCAVRAGGLQSRAPRRAAGGGGRGTPGGKGRTRWRTPGGKGAHAGEPGRRAKTPRQSNKYSYSHIRVNGWKCQVILGNKPALVWALVQQVDSGTALIRRQTEQEHIRLR